LEQRTDKLISSINGEFDIIAGQLKWKDSNSFDDLIKEEERNKQNWHPSWHSYFAALKLAEMDGIVWPPKIDYLVNIEAKCAYYDSTENKIKSKKNSQKKIYKIQKQIRRGFETGFDKVILLDVIANPPASGVNMDAWFNALAKADDSFNQMKNDFKARLSDDSPAGHWIWSVGAIEGGDELFRGAGTPINFKKTQNNFLLNSNEETKKNRIEMNQNLTILLSEVKQPKHFPVIMSYCDKCSKLHLLNEECPFKLV
jgi:hypothetical protein